ncbi:hypothetical protein Aperf_G00000009744 [Anoplocephala perfoliata]
MKMHYLIFALAMLFPLASSQTESSLNVSEDTGNSSGTILEKFNRYLLQDRATFGIKTVNGIVRSCPISQNSVMAHGGASFTVSIKRSQSMCFNVSKFVVATTDLDLGRLEIEGARMNITIEYERFVPQKVSLNADSLLMKAIKFHQGGKYITLPEVDGTVLEIIKYVIVKDFLLPYQRPS